MSEELDRLYEARDALDKSIRALTFTDSPPEPLPDAPPTASRVAPPRVATQGSESSILQDILRVVGSRADCRIWRNSVGVARSPSGRVVRFGLPGSSDILGLVRVEHAAAMAALDRVVGMVPFAGPDFRIIQAALAPVGRLLAIEVKSATGKLRPDQRAFGHVIAEMGGISIVARSVAEAVAEVDLANGGRS